MCDKLSAFKLGTRSEKSNHSFLKESTSSYMHLIKKNYFYQIDAITVHKIISIYKKTILVIYFIIYERE